MSMRLLVTVSAAALVTGICAIAPASAAAEPTPAEIAATTSLTIRFSVYEASCSGALVAPTVVLTAGHCVMRNPEARRPAQLDPASSRIYAMVGARSGRRLTAGRIRATSWSGIQEGDTIDLAVVRLSRPSAVAPVPVATAGPPPAGSPAWEVGYRNGGKRRAHYAPIRGLGACHDPRLDFNLDLCAGKRYDPDPPCAGDSGAPLFWGGQVVGVLSGYDGSFDCGYRPFIYTRTDSPRAQALIAS